MDSSPPDDDSPFSGLPRGDGKRPKRPNPTDQGNQDPNKIPKIPPMGPPPPPPRHHRREAEEQQQQRNQVSQTIIPVIIQEPPRRIIRVAAEDFKDVVQRLTGMPRPSSSQTQILKAEITARPTPVTVPPRYGNAARQPSTEANNLGPLSGGGLHLDLDEINRLMGITYLPEAGNTSGSVNDPHMISYSATSAYPCGRFAYSPPITSPYGFPRLQVTSPHGYPQAQSVFPPLHITSPNFGFVNNPGLATSPSTFANPQMPSSSFSFDDQNPITSSTLTLPSGFVSGPDNIPSDSTLATPKLTSPSGCDDNIVLIPSSSSGEVPQETSSSGFDDEFQVPSSSSAPVYDIDPEKTSPSCVANDAGGYFTLPSTFSTTQTTFPSLSATPPQAFSFGSANDPHILFTSTYSNPQIFTTLSPSGFTENSQITSPPSGFIENPQILPSSSSGLIGSPNTFSSPQITSPSTLANLQMTSPSSLTYPTQPEYNIFEDDDLLS